MRDLDADSRPGAVYAARQLRRLYPLPPDDALPSHTRALWSSLMRQTEELSGGWVAAAKRLLTQLRSLSPSGGGVRHVLVTNSQLLPAFMKLIAFGILSSFFDMDGEPLC